MNRFNRVGITGILLIGLSAVGACSDDNGSKPTADAGPDSMVADKGAPDTTTPADGSLPLPTTYEFKSRFDASKSSVSYGGQSTRHVLIAELKRFVGSLDDSSYTNPKPGDVVADLNFWYDFKNAGGTAGEPLKLTLAGGATAKQSTFGEVGSIASLKEKMPDIESGVGWQGGTVGWGDGTIKPSDLVTKWFGELETLLLNRINNAQIPKDPDGKDIAKAYVNADGVDYQQLLAKFLLGAVAFSQSADKYLDDDKAGQGLQSDNDKAVVKSGSTKPYSALEHVWDEGFGYFGAARNYGDYKDDEIAGKGGRDDFKNGHNDADSDGKVDLTSEINWGASVNAAKRDRGAVAATDFTKDAWDNFRKGRKLIVDANGALSTAQLNELKGYRDAAIGAWEKAIAATAVHYINDVLADMGTFGGASYDFLAHAKHWSELKGFALSLQFNPKSPLKAVDFKTLHDKLGDKPVLPNAAAGDITAYKQALLAARDVLENAYGFDAKNMGDDNGANGW